MAETWKVRPFTEADVRAACTWRYPEPYEVYDFPDWEVAKVRGYGICDPTVRREQFLAVTEGETLVGFFRLQDRGDHLWLGVGLHPDRCGGGNGRRLMALVLEQARLRKPGAPIRLLVRPFNTRARRCYERAGFVPTGSSVIETDTGPAEMIGMEYQPK